MLLDLDGFKDVNDTLGHAAGDAVLQLAAHRMRKALPPSVLIGRLGGDEYAIVMRSSDTLELLETAQLVLDVLLQPAPIDGIEISTNASIGITVRAPGDSKSVELLRRADVAMYQAKSTRAGAVLYDAHSDDFSRQKLRLAEELRRAIPDGQLGCGTSRRWTRPPSRCAAWRRWCAGSTRGSACCHRPSSCPRPAGTG